MYLRLIPKPEKSISILISYNGLESAVNSVLEILHRGVNPTAVEFIENSVIELGESYTKTPFPVPKSEAYLLIILDGNQNELEHNSEILKQISNKTGAVGFYPLDEKTAAQVWNMRGSLVKAVEEYSVQEPVDIVVPIDRSPEFITFVHQFEKECGMQMIAFGHAGDGNVHLCVVRGSRTEEEWHRELEANMSVIYQKAASLGGLPSGEHGIGIAKQTHFHHVTDPKNPEIMKRIKEVFDDKGILNAHKTYSNLSDRAERSFL